MRKKSSIDRVYDVLKGRILNCEYKPGQLIFEKDIVEELKVSRTPVREALNILSGEGLVTIIPKRGVQVAPLSIKRTRQIYEIRKLLEPLSISQAIKTIKPSDIEYLSKLDNTLSKSVSSRDAMEIFRYGMDIHLYIANLSGNDTLVKILRILREESYRGYVYYFRRFLDRCTEEERKAVEERLVDNHSSIVEALRDGDEQAAISYVKQDLDTFNHFAAEY